MQAVLQRTLVVPEEYDVTVLRARAKCDPPAALQAVLQRKLVVPEVYDVMVQVQELMVRSQAAPIRQACSSVLLQFLLDYPVGERRLQQHLNFIIINLSYEHETGREAAIDMLKVGSPAIVQSAWCGSTTCGV